MVKSKPPTLKVVKKPSGTKKDRKATSGIPKGYSALLEDLKSQIRTTQIKAVLKVNSELIGLYWRIGKELSRRESEEGWGAKVIERLARDLKASFPNISGFSPRNMLYMRQFADAYEDFEITQQVAAQIPWGHNLVLLDRLDNTQQRVWYAHKTLENGWSRNVLEIMIKNAVHKRHGKAITNFKNTLPIPQSDLAQNTLKDPYVLDFISLRDAVNERDIENQLATQMQKFLVELGHGFAFVGRQYPIKAGEKNLLIDLLFYHLKLRCYVVVELKAREFDSRDAGQMSAYLSAVDDLLRHQEDKPSIGMILCKTKDNVFVEYVLRNFNRPIGVAQFEVNLVEKLPKDLKKSLPTIEEIEAELEECT